MQDKTVCTGCQKILFVTKSKVKTSSLQLRNHTCDIACFNNRSHTILQNRGITNILKETEAQGIKVTCTVSQVADEEHRFSLSLCSVPFTGLNC